MDPIYYPPTSFYFKVSFNNLQGQGKNGETSFKEVSGLGVSNSTETITEGGLLEYQHKLPTNYSYTNVVMKRGLLLDSALRQWVEDAVKKFEFKPLTVQIELLKPGAKPSSNPSAIKTWTLHNAWPVKWELSNLDSLQNDVLIETMELAFSYLETK